ncbi:hypothetical protein [Flammeovirga pectinis]|nr:hypothetical protein [Flammeovirga pectinis]
MKYNYDNELGRLQIWEAAIIEKDSKTVIDLRATYGTDAEPYPDFESSNLLFQCEKVTYEVIDITDEDSQNY